MATSMMRAVVYHLPSSSAIGFFIHHMIFDGFSLKNLLNELSLYYNSNSQFTLSPLPVQFGDFVLWQRELLQSKELEKQLKFWREYIDSAPTLLDLPIDFPRTLR
eukprot:TRINITY_DN13040_c0_g1_i1.p1 TRINITY_DN13040_c0_g1~~TRINITY_DN13040_c0_g1_i1.p1  ORF type:complete len:105 (+),score=29.08 TRINITY_DN13040_c0_g1_i1:274-588(+)